MRNLFQSGLDQMWFNAQKMEADERKEAIKMIINLNPHSSGFVDYHAKFFLATMIDHSECYHNNLGYQTKVREFDRLRWYDDEGRLLLSKIVNHTHTLLDMKVCEEALLNAKGAYKALRLLNAQKELPGIASCEIKLEEALGIINQYLNPE